MRFWLFRRSKGSAAGSAAAAHSHSSGHAMSIESLEHMVRSRVRMFLRHTWLVTILGTLALAAALWAGFYFTTEADHMRIAAGPVDAKFVQALTNQIAKGHQNLSLQIVPTQGSRQTAQAISKGDADLAVLPSNLEDSVNWPVIAIVRQNVMALIVPLAQHRRQSQRRPEFRTPALQMPRAPKAPGHRMPKAPKARRAQRKAIATIAMGATIAVTAPSSARSRSFPGSASASSPAMRRRRAYLNSC